MDVGGHEPWPGEQWVDWFREDWKEKTRVVWVFDWLADNSSIDDLHSM